MRYGVLEYDQDMDLARHARGQLMDFTGDIAVDKVDRIHDIPGAASRMAEDVDGLLVLLPVKDEALVDQVMSQLMRIEVDTGVPMEKVIIRKQGMNRHDFRTEAQGQSMERAEVLVRKTEK